jgi:hypothetical protein
MTLREFVICESCGKVLHILAATVIKVESQPKRVCQRCLQRLERQDTREYLEE